MADSIIVVFTMLVISIPNPGVLPSFKQDYAALDFLSRPRMASVGALMYVRPGKRSRIRQGRPKALVRCRSPRWSLSRRTPDQGASR